jgi:hypothetical protein
MNQEQMNSKTIIESYGITLQGKKEGKYFERKIIVPVAPVDENNLYKSILLKNLRQTVEEKVTEKKSVTTVIKSSIRGVSSSPKEASFIKYMEKKNAMKKTSNFKNKPRVHKDHLKPSTVKQTNPIFSFFKRGE